MATAVGVTASGRSTFAWDGSSGRPVKGTGTGAGQAACAAEHGSRSVLVADLGVLTAFDSMWRIGALPADMQAKVSVMLPVANAASAQVVERLGANTLNLATDLSLPQIAAVRAAVDIPLDIYIESPDSLGGFIRMHEIAEIIRVAAPVYLKFGLQNAPDI
jgi:hypothetical protein